MAYEIATNDITMIPLNKLIPSGLNARKITTSAENNAELRASLLAFGVLENLIVYGAGKDKYAVAAGERRRASLKLFLKEKKIPANFAVWTEVNSQAVFEIFCAARGPLTAKVKMQSC